MILRVLVFGTLLAVSGCSGHHLTGYNLKASTGQTSYEDGGRSLFTGVSADFHIDVK